MQASIVICVLNVLFNIGANAFFAPEQVVQRELAGMTRDYYEDFFYDNFVGNMKQAEIEKQFSRYATNGFPRIKLYQLLQYDNQRQAEKAKYFNYKDFTCNTDGTYVMIYPEAPYGKTNYRMETHLDCG